MDFTEKEGGIYSIFHKILIFLDQISVEMQKRRLKFLTKGEFVRFVDILNINTEQIMELQYILPLELGITPMVASQQKSAILFTMNNIIDPHVKTLININSLSGIFNQTYENW